MHTIVITSPKGGTGKSTIAGHLAVEAERRRAGPVAIVDTDPQGSLAEWWNAREAQAPLFATVSTDELPARLTALDVHGAQLVIIDTPPAFTPATHKTLAVADLVIVPLRPSPHDLRSVGTILEAVEGQGKPYIFVLNAATPRTTIAVEAVRALAQHGKVAPATLHNRIDFATSMVDGRTAGELRTRSRSAGEVAELWVFVNKQLRRSAKA